MERIELTKDEFKNLEQLNLHDILCTEGKFYVYPTSDTKSLIKCFYMDDKEFLENKTKTVISLNAKKSLFDLPEIIYPTQILSVDGKDIGYVMPYVEDSFNLKKFLENPNFPFEDKKKYLYQIGQLLEKMRIIRKNLPESKQCFYLNDIHEGNFIVDIKTDSIKAVDTDSAYIDANLICPAKYLRPLQKFYKFQNKYPTTSKNGLYGEQLIPNDNTCNYSLCLMILNMIAKENISLLTPTALNQYLHYLSRIGYSDKTLEPFFLLFTDCFDNKSPLSIIEDIEENPLAEYRQFKWQSLK